MPRIILKIVFALFFWGLFAVIVLQIPYPDNFINASFLQLGSFFVPLSLAILFTVNILIKNFLISLFISFGVIILLILQAVEVLNIFTGGLIIIAEVVLLSYIRKIQRKNLTKLPKIPKLTSLQTKK